MRKIPALIATLDHEALTSLAHDWALFARADQIPPTGQEWTSWLVMGGRGAGKTRTGAEWVRGVALGHAPFAAKPAGRIALVAETLQDLREVMVEGVSGLLRVHPKAERPIWHASRRRLEWPNGAIAQGFSAEDPESLRGPQFDAAWCDELAKWRQPEATFDMLQFALRLGERPRQVITTTPRPIALLRRLLADPRTVISRAHTSQNAHNLSPHFLQSVVARYAGTALGRQELAGEWVEDRPDALFARAQIEQHRRMEAPECVRIVVAIDPPAGGKRGGRCGIVVAGCDASGQIYVLEDASLESAKPEAWAARALAAYHRHMADALIAEVNQGGDMVSTVLGTIDPGVPVQAVRAKRGKVLRAEPVAALYAQGRVHHIGALPTLEDEMIAFGADGLAGGRSPDRLDALVWAISDLALRPEIPAPRVRRFD